MPTLEWIGKSKVINHHQEVPFRVLERKYKRQGMRGASSASISIRRTTQQKVPKRTKHGYIQTM